MTTLNPSLASGLLVLALLIILMAPQVIAASAAASATGSFKGPSSEFRGGFSIQSDGEKVKGEFQLKGPDGLRVHVHEFSSLSVSEDCQNAFFSGTDTNGAPFSGFLLDSRSRDGTDFLILLDLGLFLPGSVKIHCAHV